MIFYCQRNYSDKSHSDKFSPPFTKCCLSESFVKKYSNKPLQFSLSSCSLQIIAINIFHHLLFYCHETLKHTVYFNCPTNFSSFKDHLRWAFFIFLKHLTNVRVKILKEKINFAVQLLSHDRQRNINGT